MAEFRIRLPKQVFEVHFGALLAELAQAQRSGSVVFDFSRVDGTYIPAAITSVVATVNHIRDRGGKWRFENHTQCKAFRYFQRMDVFAAIGLDLEESFRRHEGSPDFIPIKS